MARHPARCFLPLLAALSLQLAGCSDDSAGTTTTQPPRSTSPSGQANDPSAAAPTWKFLADQPEDVPLRAGDYGLTPNGVSGKVAVVRTPEGYLNLGGWTFVAGEPFRALGFVTADRVYPDPCGSRLRSKAETARDPGPSVEDLAAALVAQKGATTSPPRPVTVDGHDGLYLDYQVSKGIDVRDCGDRAFDIFSTGPGSWYLEVSRERAAIWILDVDGERLVLSWVALPGVNDRHLREMTEMAESARFVEAE